MTDEDFKRILDESLEPIKGQLSEVTKRLDDPKTGLQRVNNKLDAVWEQTVKLAEGQEELKEDVDALKVEVHDMHKEFGAFKDKTISEIDKVKEHVGLPTSINSIG